MRTERWGYSASIKTHCKYGHEFNEANTRTAPSGGRVCKVCEKDRAERRRRENGAQPRNFTRAPRSKEQSRAELASVFASGTSDRTCGHETGSFCTSGVCGPDPSMWGHDHFDENLQCHNCKVGLVEFRATLTPCIGRVR